MSTSTSQDLVLAVRSGKLSEVIALLESGAGQHRSLDFVPALAAASFLGHCDMVRELVNRGALLNLPAGLAGGEPLAMAIKGCQRNVIRQLIGLGAQIPPGVDTGLSEKELADAQRVARRRLGGDKEAPVAGGPSIVPSPVVAASGNPGGDQFYLPADENHPLASLSSPRYRPPVEMPDSSAPPPAPQMAAAIEEIEMTACYGVDTSVLESDLMRSKPDGVNAGEKPEEMLINAPELDLEATPALKKRWSLPFFPPKKTP